MSAMSEATIAELDKFSVEIAQLEDEYDEKMKTVLHEYQGKMAPVIAERQKFIDTIPDFWCAVLASPGSPLTPAINSTTDPKLLRAVTHFNVATSTTGSTPSNTVTILFRPNPFIESTEVKRQLSDTLETISLTPIKWKAGTENARKDSVFSFFSEDCSKEELLDTLEAFKACHLSPFLLLEQASN